MKNHGLQEKIVVNSSQKFHFIGSVGLKDGATIAKIINQTEGLMLYDQFAKVEVAKYLVDGIITNYTGFSSIFKGEN